MSLSSEVDHPAIRIRGLVKSYGDVPALSGIDLDIRRGQFFGLLGPNGAGKSTTIHILTGLVTFAEGDVRVLGHDVVREYRLTRRRIGLAPQEFNFDRFFPAREILILQAGYYGIPRREAGRRADELLERFGLSSKAADKIWKLSGGMKRRLLIAKAMIHDPDILILDEPTAGVDVELRRALWVYLRKLNAEGKTILLTTHYIEEAEELCEEVAIIDQGRIVAQGSPDELVQAGGERHLEIRLTTAPESLPEAVTGRDHFVENDRVVIRAPHPRRIVAEVLNGLYAMDLKITEVRIKESSLEEVFVQLTGRTIDSGPAEPVGGALDADGADEREEELHEV
ncbi:MAG TPA: ATP-binding cassette domain-containing protein [Gemmatimonadota bacterium]|nr:ATP-binding cassette domain-containing protein [Gemmatimonadota bacterium]